MHDPFADLEPGVRRWVRRLFWAIALTLILGLSISALFATALNLAPEYRQKIEAFASDVAQRPLHIGDLQLRWRGWYPSLDLLQVEVLTADGKKPQLRVEKMRIGFSPWRLVFGDFNPIHIELAGLELSAVVDAEGQWRIEGLESFMDGGGETDFSETLRQLARFESIAFQRCTLLLHDARLGKTPLRFNIDRVVLVQGLRGPRLDLAVTLPEAVGQRLKLRARMRGKLEEPQNWNGDWSAELEGLSALPWLKLLKPELAGLQIQKGQLLINGEIQAGAPVWSDLNLRASAVRSGPPLHQASLQDLALKARIARQPFGWGATIQSLQVKGVRGVWPVTQGAVTLITPSSGQGEEWAGQLSFLRLDDVAPWLALLAPDLPTQLLQISGDLRSVDASFRAGLDAAPSRYSFRAAVEQLAMPPLESSPGFSGLSGDLALDENSGRLGLRDNALTLLAPQTFTLPVRIDSLSADLRWKRETDGWSVSAPAFNWKFSGSEGSGQMAMALPSQAPVALTLKSKFSVQDAARLKPFMPRTWGDGLRQWLTKALLRVPITTAQLTIDGALDTWVLDARLNDAEVFYADGWPAIKGLNAAVDLRDGSIVVNADKGRIADIPIQKIEARIPDFSRGDLQIDGQLSGELERLLAVLAASPLRSRFEGMFKHTRAKGPARLGLRLEIPLEDASKTAVSGRVAIDGAELLLTDINETVRDLRGEVAFGPEGISARKLEGQLLSQPLSGSIAARKNSSTLTAFWVLDLTKDSPVSKLLPEGLSSRITGNTALRAQLNLTGPEPVALVLDSDLRGLTLRLPAPLAKTATTAAPMRVVIAQDPQSGPRLTADWTGRLGADLRWRLKAGKSQLDALTLRLGRDAPVFAEVLPGLSIGAVASDLSIDDWSDFIDGLGAAKSTLGTLSLTRVNLRATRWLWRGFALPQTMLRVQPDGAAGEQRWRLRFDGAGATGEALWTREKIQLQLAHLALEHNPNPVQARESKTVFDPGEWPALEANIGRFDLAEASFGAVQLQTQRVPGGMRLSRLTTEGGENAITSTGLWLRRDGQSSANLALKLDSSDFEGVQRAFGFGATLVAKSSRLNTQAVWAPSARGIDWQQARGDLSLEFDNGALRGVEPGVGRVLGLFNFFALPRRLSFNFSDVGGKGLAFDTVRGNFTLADGQARTENVKVDGPSLRIEMRGRAGLVARDYDQYVTVYPGLSTGFTLGAALLAGPIGAGLVFLAQQILDQPLEKLTQINYHVTGSWDDPKVSRGKD